MISGRTKADHVARAHVLLRDAVEVGDAGLWGWTIRHAMIDAALAVSTPAPVSPSPRDRQPLRTRGAGYASTQARGSHTCAEDPVARGLLFSPHMTTSTKHLVGEVVELSRDCELGQEGDRAVVTARVDHYMTLTFPDRARDCREVHTGADYKYLRPCTQSIACATSDLGARQSNEVLRELRSLISTYLEGSDDADRAWELLDALDVAVAS